MLTEPQIERFARQVLLPEIGGKGQVRLLASSLFLEGVDDSSAWAAAYVAASGVGRLVLCDARPVTGALLGPFLLAGGTRAQALGAALRAHAPSVRCELVEGGGAADSPATFSLLGVDENETTHTLLQLGAAGDRAAVAWQRETSCRACFARDFLGRAGLVDATPSTTLLAGALAATELTRALLGLPGAGHGAIVVDRAGPVAAAAAPSCPHRRGP